MSKQTEEALESLIEHSASSGNSAKNLLVTFLPLVRELEADLADLHTSLVLARVLEDDADSANDLGTMENRINSIQESLRSIRTLASDVSKVTNQLALESPKVVARINARLHPEDESGAEE